MMNLKLVHIFWVDKKKKSIPVDMLLTILLISTTPDYIFSSPEHKVLKVTYCGQSMSVGGRPSSSCGVRPQQQL